MASSKTREFVPLNLAIVTVSDTRTEAEDTSGKVLVDRTKEAGHCVAQKTIVTDDIYDIRSVISQCIADAGIDVVITTGGTGITGRDGTPEAVAPLLDKVIEGFGEIFRTISWEEIASASLQSRCLSGVANGTYIFCLPGSSNACRTGWDKIIVHQLDHRTQPCNLVDLIPRLKEQ